MVETVELCTNAIRPIEQVEHLSSEVHVAARQPTVNSNGEAQRRSRNKEMLKRIYEFVVN